MSKFVTFIGWGDVPHLKPPIVSEEELDALTQDMLPHERKARMTGKPALGSGAIYPVDEDNLIIEPIPIPDHWERAFAMDVGWKKTAALVGARDPDANCFYLTHEYYQGKQEPIIHSAGIKSMLPWPDCFGALDPAAAGSNQKDGTKLKDAYIDQGLNLVKANNSVESGIHNVLIAMQEGRLKIFNTLTYLLTELRVYRRDENGKIVKERDHLMDCLRYLLNTSGIFFTQVFQDSLEEGGYGEW
jgi:hypothetical protein